MPSTNIFTPGAGTFTPGTGIQAVLAEVWGSGGAGGTSGGTTAAGSGGGGGAAYARKNTITVTPNVAVSLYLGVAPSAANSGEDSWFKSTSDVLAKGGIKGVNSSGVNTPGGAGTAGQASGCVGDTKLSGGTPAAGTTTTGGGGGGGPGAALLPDGTGAGSGGGAGNAASGATGGAAKTAGGGAGGAGVATGAGAAGVVAGGGGGGGGLLGGAGGAGGAGFARVWWVEVGNLQSDTSFTDKETLVEPPGTVASAAAMAQMEALADLGTTLSVAALTGSDALFDLATLASSAGFASAEALADLSLLASVATLIQRESIVDPPGDIASAAILTALEAIADGGTLSTQAVLSALEALAEFGDALSIAAGSGPWRLLSPGLAGTVFDATGSTPLAGAQVLVFRDDTNALIASLTSDGAGEWALDLDPAYLYWISGWKDSPQIEDRTERGIATVETEIASGTSS